MTILWHNVKMLDKPGRLTQLDLWSGYAFHCFSLSRANTLTFLHVSFQLSCTNQGSPLNLSQLEEIQKKPLVTDGREGFSSANTMFVNCVAAATILLMRVT